MERRTSTQSLSLRMMEEDGQKYIEGYSAVFYNESNDGTEYRVGPYRERIGRRAFSRAINENHDTRCLFNHDASLLLGRTTAGTCTLSVDDMGLRFRASMPDTQLGRDVATLMERGDITGCSFAFEIMDESEPVRQEDGTYVVEIRDLKLYDVGPVTYPAYEATSVHVRTEMENKREERLEKIQKQQAKEQEAISVRKRVVDLSMKNR